MKAEIDFSKKEITSITEADSKEFIELLGVLEQNYPGDWKTSNGKTLYYLPVHSAPHVQIMDSTETTIKQVPYTITTTHGSDK